MGHLPDITAVIKTFERPARLSAAMLSLRAAYPSLPIVLVDDSRRPLQNLPLKEAVAYLRTGFDIGVSAGRNLGVDQVRTEFVLLMDDDVVLRRETRIEKMLDVAKRNYGVVSARQLDFTTRERVYHGMFETDGTVLIQRDSDPRRQGAVAPAHYTHNFFVAPTAVLRDVRWDEELKMGEHWDFFLRLHRAGHPIQVCTDVFYNHFPIRRGTYYAYRRRAAHFDGIALAKHGFTRLRRYERDLSPGEKLRYGAAKLWFGARTRLSDEAA